MGALYNAYCRAYQGVYKAASNFLDWTAPEVISGADSVLKIPEILKKNSIKNVMLVTDNGLMNLGLPDGLINKLNENAIKCSVFSDVQPNPSIENVENAKDLYIKDKCQAIIAMGGGSPMDCAKAAGARVANPNKTVSQMRGQLKVSKPLPLFIAIPTTAGTGSETTIAAVITDMSTHEKYAINDIKLRPKYAVLDPKLTVGLPPHITSTTGIDALTHAVEAYIGHSNTKETAKCAEKATKMIFQNLEKAYNNGADLKARDNMLKASYYAGVAFTRAYVGYVHAIAHQLGGIYGIPHGLANAVILPYVLEFFGETAYAPLARLSECAGTAQKEKSEKENAVAFIEGVKSLNKRIGIPDKFECIQEKDIPIIVERALREGNPLYPVPKIMNEQDCAGIIRRFMAK